MLVGLYKLVKTPENIRMVGCLGLIGWVRHLGRKNDWGSRTTRNLLKLIVGFYQFCSIKLHFALLNNIIDSFKSNTIVTNFSTTFLQTVEVVNFFWFTSRPTTYITFLLTNNHSLHQQFVKKNCNSSIFFFLKAIKIFIGTSPKKLSPTTKITNSKIKNN